MICCSARRPKRQLFVKRDHVTGANFLSATDGEPFNPSPNAVLILTLRMGFGHLRIAHAVASWLDGARSPSGSWTGRRWAGGHALRRGVAARQELIEGPLDRPA